MGTIFGFYVQVANVNQGHVNIESKDCRPFGPIQKEQSILEFYFQEIEFVCPFGATENNLRKLLRLVRNISMPEGFRPAGDNDWPVTREVVVTEDIDEFVQNEQSLQPNERAEVLCWMLNSTEQISKASRQMNKLQELFAQWILQFQTPPLDSNPPPTFPIFVVFGPEAMAARDQLVRHGVYAFDQVNNLDGVRNTLVELFNKYDHPLTGEEIQSEEQEPENQLEIEGSRQHGTYNNYLKYLQPPTENLDAREY